MSPAVASGALADVADATGSVTTVLAHQGGWDEILLVVGPLAVVALLLWLANRRVSAQLEAATAEAEGNAEGNHGTGGEGDGPTATQPPA